MLTVLAAAGAVTFGRTGKRAASSKRRIVTIWRKHPNGSLPVKAAVKYAGKTPAQHRQRSVSLIIDIQKKCQEKGPGYQQWAKVHNVKQLAQSVYLMRERGCRTISELSVRADDQIKNEMIYWHPSKHLKRGWQKSPL